MIDRPNVVFDCDGVLVDSESLSWGAWTSVLGSHGYLPNQEDQQESFGRRTQDLYMWFARRVELPPIDVFNAELQQEVLRRFDDSLTPFEDALDLLRRLEATDIVIAVASSSSRERLDHALNITGLAAIPFS